MEIKNPKALAEGLSKLLADTYVLYLKTHGFHWNVTGPMFVSLHQSFEEQYTELWQATDVIAERIRSLGSFAPGTYSEYQDISTIKETTGVPNANEMIQLLFDGNQAAAATARSVVRLAEENGDISTADLATQRLRVHEKTAWMLKSMQS